MRKNIDVTQEGGGGGGRGGTTWIMGLNFVCVCVCVCLLYPQKENNYWVSSKSEVMWEP